MVGEPAEVVGAAGVGVLEAMRQMVLPAVGNRTATPARWAFAP